MTTLRKTFELGKIAYYGSRRENAVDVTIELREKEHGELEFSATGNIWNRIHTDILSGGQNLDEIAKFKGNNPIFKEIYKFWKLYHLNTMHPECKHQAALGWREKAAEKVTIYEFSLNCETSREQTQINSKILGAAKTGTAYTPTEHEQKIINLEYFLKTDNEELPEELRAYYKPYRKETKSLGWLKPEEHPEGILTKECPVCGYKYGTSWNYFEIPENDLNRIKELLTEEK